MEQNQPLSPGSKANLRLIENLHVDNEELHRQIPDACMDCSTAWLYTFHNRGKEKVQACMGKSEIEVGGISIMACGINAPQEQLVPPLSPESTEPMGENLGEDLSRPAARHANRRVRSEPGANTYADLGELGEHNVKDLRFRDSAKKGFLTAYIRSREKVSDHKIASTIAVSTIAIGVVVGSVKHLKHRNN